ncbi:o-succinylbenzoate--CoA ligase [Brochothrix campestris]|uniref:2-succinylbenzoate--CoA ligase n=1 Tax=Brochothrix campestris FSL F6-1037 TaxID=1265861 RepID=W7CMW1_9LIST|nr:o-succinylbenzoate--CoA ligase [Brochothrix campestris]EUJ38010.1 O-succinylbenzoic acid--CoA ligase [Brochothrix campestris FSL F6-1037]
MRVSNWLLQRVQQTPTAVALITDEQTLTFADVWQTVTHLAAKLQTVVAAGDHVAVLGENKRDFYELILALQQVGAVTVFLNNRLTPREINYQLQQSDATLLLHATNFKELVDSLNVTNLPALSFVSVANMTATPLQLRSTLELKTTASLMFTSGSTGHPKAVQQTYGNHLASATGTAMMSGLSTTSRWYCAVPLFHISGLSILMRSLLFGCAVVLAPKFRAEQLQQLLATGAITHASVVTTMLHRLMQAKTPFTCHPNVQLVLLGGGPVTRELLTACQAWQLPVTPSYGMTETAAQAVAMPLDQVATKLGSAGIPLFQTELRIGNGDTPPQTVGDIWLRGGNITPGYYQHHSDDFIDGWFKTGDIGYLDTDGYLFVKERAGDLIISGGENIYPTEIEHVLLQHPLVSDVAVIGEYHPQWEQVPIAYIVSEHPLHKADLEAFIATKLAKYKWPQRYVTVAKIPRTATGKIQRHRLRNKS